MSSNICRNEGKYESLNKELQSILSKIQSNPEGVESTFPGTENMGMGGPVVDEVD